MICKNKIPTDFLIFTDHVIIPTDFLIFTDHVIILTDFLIFTDHVIIPIFCHNETEFSCEDGECIPKTYRCDGDADCGDEIRKSVGIIT
jgi:hypothetical protein